MPCTHNARWSRDAALRPSELNEARSQMTGSRSSGFEEGFEADAEILAVFEAVEQGELIDEDGAEGEASGADEATGWDRAVHVEDALELAVEVLDGVRAQLMEDATDLDAVVGVWVGAPAGGDQEAAGPSAVVADGRVVVEGVSEDEARLGRGLVEQPWGRLVVGGVG